MLNNSYPAPGNPFEKNILQNHESGTSFPNKTAIYHSLGGRNNGKEVDVMKQSSHIYHLLSPENQKRHTLILQDYRLIPEMMYLKTERYGVDAVNSGIRQSNLEHIVHGLQILENFRREFPSLFEKVSYDDVQWMWLLHDIGEWGMKQDITTHKKNDLSSSADDKDEQENALGYISQIQDETLQEKSKSLYLQAENRWDFDERGKLSAYSLAGCISRFIDKLEPLGFTLLSDMTKYRYENHGQQIAENDMKNASFGKLLLPARIIYKHLNDEEKVKMKKLINVYLQEYKNNLEGFSNELFAELRKEIRKVLSNTNFMKNAKEKDEIGIPQI